MKKYNVNTAMKPHNTIKRSLVRPIDKVELQHMCEWVYSIACKGCNATYIGEMKRTHTGDAFANANCGPLAGPRTFKNLERICISFVDKIDKVTGRIEVFCSNCDMTHKIPVLEMDTPPNCTTESLLLREFTVISHIRRNA